MKRVVSTDSEMLAKRREQNRARQARFRTKHRFEAKVTMTDSEKLARRRELGKIRAARYREKHPGKVKERNEAHYQKNRYEIRVNQAKAYAANPERYKEINLKSIKKTRG